jgi:hypothetical protein
MGYSRYVMHDASASRSPSRLRNRLLVSERVADICGHWTEFPVTPDILVDREGVYVGNLFIVGFFVVATVRDVDSDGRFSFYGLSLSASRSVRLT